ncbi:hypothetical protein KCU74_g2873, partial [Aureobasidium melanogenum]
MDQNNYNNTIFGSTRISDLTHGQHTENPTSSSETSPSSIFRPHLDALPLSLITLPDGFPEFTASYPEIEYTVPESVFAESCPVCDEIAMESIEEGFIARYPRGWVLVACQRHVEVLRTSSGGTHVCVGGQLELRSKAAYRFQERELKRSEEKAVEKRAAAANTAAAAAAAATSAVADKVPETPPSTPTSSTAPTPTPQDPCPICLATPPTLLLSCTHTFCTPCLTHWQTTSLDTALSTWLSSCRLLLSKYPILSATLKSRFTCPMCRANLQFTKQSRRKKKIGNKISRGENVGGVMAAARSRRGGQRNRRRGRGRGRFGDGVLRSEWMPTDPRVIAPESMPVVQRAQARQDDPRGVD